MQLYINRQSLYVGGSYYNSISVIMANLIDKDCSGDLVVGVVNDAVKALCNFMYQVVYSAVSDAVKPQPCEDSVSETMDVDQTADYLTSLGVPMTAKKIYRLSRSKKLPYKKFGHRNVYSRKDVYEWYCKNLKDVDDRTHIAAIHIAESARRKGG